MPADTSTVAVSALVAPRAIVIDDSRAMRMILRNALVEHGFDVTEAADGRQAADALAASGPLDLALVDWNMPVMTGYDLVRALRADPRFDAMAIMMVSTESEATQVQRALDAGANEYMMKPFTSEVLGDKLLLLGLVED